MKLEKYEIESLAELLDMAIYRFGNDCCTDLPGDFLKNWPLEKLIEADKKFNDWNNSPDDFDPDFLAIASDNWCLMTYLKLKLLGEIK